jgi:hypothetical protein
MNETDHELGFEPGHEARQEASEPPAAAPVPAPEIDYDQLAAALAPRLQAPFAPAPQDDGQAYAPANSGADSYRSVLEAIAYEPDPIRQEEMRVALAEQRLSQQFGQRYDAPVAQYAAQNAAAEICHGLPENAKAYARRQLAALPPQQIAQLSGNPQLRDQVRMLAAGYAALNPTAAPLTPEGIGGGGAPLSGEESGLINSMAAAFPGVNFNDPRLLAEMRSSNK